MPHRGSHSLLKPKTGVGNTLYNAMYYVYSWSPLVWYMQFWFHEYCRTNYSPPVKQPCSYHFFYARLLKIAPPQKPNIQCIMGSWDFGILTPPASSDAATVTVNVRILTPARYYSEIQNLALLGLLVLSTKLAIYSSIVQSHNANSCFEQVCMCYTPNWQFWLTQDSFSSGYMALLCVHPFKVTPSGRSRNFTAHRPRSTAELESAPDTFYESSKQNCCIFFLFDNWSAHAHNLWRHHNRILRPRARRLAWPAQFILDLHTAKHTWQTASEINDEN